MQIKCIWIDVAHEKKVGKEEKREGKEQLIKIKIQPLITR
jgi:hypothetical protein